VKFFQALEEGKKLLVWWSELLLDATLDDVSLPAVSSPPALDRPGLMTGSGRMSRPPAGFASPAAEKKETLNKRKTNAKQTRLQKKTKNKPISESESEETPAANPKKPEIRKKLFETQVEDIDAVLREYDEQEEKERKQDVEQKRKEERQRKEERELQKIAEITSATPPKPPPSAEKKEDKAEVQRSPKKRAPSLSGLPRPADPPDSAAPPRPASAPPPASLQAGCLDALQAEVASLRNLLLARPKPESEQDALEDGLRRRLRRRRRHQVEESDDSSDTHTRSKPKRIVDRESSETSPHPFQGMKLTPRDFFHAQLLERQHFEKFYAL